MNLLKYWWKHGILNPEKWILKYDIVCNGAFAVQESGFRLILANSEEDAYREAKRWLQECVTYRSSVSYYVRKAHWWERIKR